jgi:lactate dehydrogenase-like 2-hydroxyacid dehydrogenase
MVWFMSKIKLPKLVIFTAKGRGSFSVGQRQRLAGAAQVTYVRAPDKIRIPEFRSWIKDANFVAPSPRSFPPKGEAALLTASLKGVALPTTGYEWMDVGLLLKDQRVVTHVPQFSSAATAEFTWSLILGRLRNLPLALKSPGKKRGPLIGRELDQKTLGILGLGSIGERVALTGRALGMTVLGHDRRSRKISGVRQTTVAQILKKSDVLSLHLPLSPSTRHFIDRKSLKLLKKDCLVVNTARPDLVDLVAMKNFLKKNSKASYLYDRGYWSPPATRRGGRVGNCWALPHISWYTRESMAREMELWVQEMIALVQGSPRSRLKNL